MRKAFTRQVTRFTRNSSDPARNSWSVFCQCNPHDMSKLRTLAVFSLWLVLTFVLTFARSAAAPDPPTPPAPPPPAPFQDRAEATPPPAQPAFTFITLPTT